MQKSILLFSFLSVLLSGCGESESEKQTKGFCNGLATLKTDDPVKFAQGVNALKGQYKDAEPDVLNAYTEYASFLIYVEKENPSAIGHFLQAGLLIGLGASASFMSRDATSISDAIKFVATDAEEFKKKREEINKKQDVVSKKLKSADSVCKEFQS